VLYAGLDLSAVNDLSAFVLVGKKGENWHSHCRFWLPQDGLADKAAADHAPYDAWARQGHLSTTPGRTIDYDFVAHALHEVFRQHNIQKVAYDPWHFDFFKPSLLRARFTESTIAECFVEFPQTTTSMSPASASHSAGGTRGDRHERQCVVNKQQAASNQEAWDRYVDGRIEQHAARQVPIREEQVAQQLLPDALRDALGQVSRTIGGSGNASAG
jgi:hypothetical protein